MAMTAEQTASHHERRHEQRHERHNRRRRRGTRLSRYGIKEKRSYTVKHVGVAVRSAGTLIPVKPRYISRNAKGLVARDHPRCSRKSEILRYNLLAI